MRKLSGILYVAILTVAAVAFSAPARSALHSRGGQSCPEHWVGVPCNTQHFCNYSDHNWHIPGCTCDLTNFCENGQ